MGKGLEMRIEELIKDELAFCKENDCTKNEHGQYVYYSSDEKSIVNLPMLLLDYKEWLIEKKLMKGAEQ